MPTAQASATKANARKFLSIRMGDWYELTTTSAGNAGGTTLVSTSLAGYSDTFFVNHWVLLTSGASSGQWRQCITFTQSTGTITLDRSTVSATQIASAVTFELHKYRPDILSTLAPNEARFRAFPSCYKQEIDYVLASAFHSVFGAPRGMRKVWKVSQSQLGAVLSDTFNRADSTTRIGGSWVGTPGTWGVLAERGYSVSDADADIITFDANCQDGILSCIVSGTLNSATVYRSPALCFRIVEDYTGALPAAGSRSYLLVRLLNGVVDLRLVLAGTETSLRTTAVTTSDGVDYRLKVIFECSSVRVLLNAGQLITYRLDEPSRAGLSGVRVGVRGDKGGAPATAARIDDFRIHSLATGYEEHHDWKQSADDRIIEFGHLGQRNGLFWDERYLKFEGGDVLSAGADDSTPGTIASDTTAVYEIEVTDPAWDVFVDFLAWCAWEKMAMPGVGDEADLARYEKEAERARQRAMAGAAVNRMARPIKCLMYPY